MNYDTIDHVIFKWFRIPKSDFKMYYTCMLHFELFRFFFLLSYIQSCTTRRFQSVLIAPTVMYNLPCMISVGE